jgi:hypothetical protein
MLERARDFIYALNIDGEMEKVVRSGMPGRYTGDEWGEECFTIATSRRTGKIERFVYEGLSPAGKALLPEELVIK